MKTRTEWLDIIRRDYAHLSDAADEELADHILATHPDHCPESKREDVIQSAMSVMPTVADSEPWLKRIFWAIIALIVATILAPCLHAANGTSQIDVICIQNSNLSGGKSCFAAPFSLNMSTGFTCTRSGKTVTCTGGGTITNNPAGADHELQTYDGGAFGFVAEAGLGKVLIDQGPGNAPAFADPLVQGTQAAASTTIPNPVVGGGSDYGGTPAVRVWKVDSSGNGYAVITTLPALPAGTNVIGHVIADSGSTTAVTGNVASTVADGANVTLGAKADAKSTATDTTAVTFMQVLKEISFMEQTPASRAVTNAGTFGVQLSQYTPASGRLPVDPSGVTSPVSLAALPALPAGTNNIGSVNLGTTPDPCGPGQAKSYQFYDASTNGATQMVALSSGKVIYVCSYSLTSSSTTANTIKLVYGTGSDCATGQTAITPGYVLQAATSTGPIGKVNSNSAGLQTIASNELCVLTNAAQAAQVEVSYVQQ